MCVYVRVCYKQVVLAWMRSSKGRKKKVTGTQGRFQMGHMDSFTFSARTWPHWNRNGITPKRPRCVLGSFDCRRGALCTGTRTKQPGRFHGNHDPYSASEWHNGRTPLSSVRPSAATRRRGHAATYNAWRNAAGWLGTWPECHSLARSGKISAGFLENFPWRCDMFDVGGRCCCSKRGVQANNIAVVFGKCPRVFCLHTLPPGALKVIFGPSLPARRKSCSAGRFH